ncbi:hypothetical protein OE88DRAFT_1656102 [Heliocybe sulcata]|uniref:Uncharacterized protein n=1 Tax=Heliocybe sulcata TaxID=5364 RepID=A0A5C3N8W2_9AGAM|nr:hypothetical protein OE88DRAFT_1656102 [Heliocybe sulcata]
MTSKPESQDKYDGRSAVELGYGLQVSVSPSSASNTLKVHAQTRDVPNYPRQFSASRSSFNRPRLRGVGERAYERSASLFRRRRRRI